MALMEDPNLKKNIEDQNQGQMTGGNIYSTSGSEVDTTQSGNNSSFPTNTTNKDSNTSGNWVNLGAYLDANSRKSGDYANRLVQNKLNTQDDYKTGLNDAVTNYGNTIKQDTAYQTGSDASKNIITKGAKNLSNLSSADQQILGNTLKGYQGQGQIESTGDEYGLFNLRNQSEGYNKFAEGLLDNDYRSSLMNPTMSSGARKLNSFLLGSKDAQQEFQNSSNAFKDLASLYGSSIGDADSIYNDVLRQATLNQQSANSNLDTSYKELENWLNQQYNSQLDSANKQKAKAGSVSNSTKTMKTNTLGTPQLELTVNPLYQWNTNEKQAQDMLRTEKDELKDRINYLRSLGDPSVVKQAPTSQLDSNFNFGSLTENYDVPSEAVRLVSGILGDIRSELTDEIKKEGYSLASNDPQEYARRTFSNIVANDPEVKRLAQEYVNAYVRGQNPDLNSYKKQIKNRVVLNYSPDWLESVLAPIDQLARGDFMGFIEKTGDVVTAPIDWGVNAVKSGWNTIKGWFD